MQIHLEKIAGLCEDFTDEVMDGVAQTYNPAILEIAIRINDLGLRMMDGRINPQKVIAIIQAIYYPDPGSLN